MISVQDSAEGGGGGGGTPLDDHGTEVLRICRSILVFCVFLLGFVPPPEDSACGSIRCATGALDSLDCKA